MLIKFDYHPFLLTLLGINLFSCFSASGGMGNLGSKSLTRFSMPIIRNKDMKLFRVMF